MSRLFPSFYQNIRQVAPDYWLMLFLVFFMKAGQFMLLPYLALYLTKTTNASVTLIGFTVGIGPLIYGLVGPFGGYFIDRFGRRTVIINSVFGSGLIFVLFNVSHTILYYMLMNALVGVTRSLFDTASRSYKAHMMNPEFRRFCFSLRFVAVNAGAGAGPLIGLFFFQSEAPLFISNGLIFMILAFVIFYYMKNVDDYSESLKPPGILQVFKVMAIDARLACIVIAATLMWVCYSQLDSIFGIYLTQRLHDGIKILTWTFLVNTTGCIFLQMPMARVMGKMREEAQVIFGTTMYMCGFLLIPLVFHISFLLFACFLVVLGEVSLSPFMDLLVFKIAPANMVGSYYGALAMGMLGVGFGPMIGGVFYQYLSAKSLFFFCALLFAVMGFLFWTVVSKKHEGVEVS